MMRYGSGKQIPVLNGVRAIAVCFVIIFHFWQEFGQHVSALLGKFAVWGQTGVDLFFVLSGFLITGILLDAKGKQHFLRNFYARRILRIFPLYYVTLTVFYIVFPMVHLGAWIPWRHSIWYWFYLQNIPGTFAPDLATGPGHFWSLAVEEHFYLVWPFLVMLLSHRGLLRAVAASVAVALVSRIVFINYGIFVFTLCRLDGLAIGSAMAVLARMKPGGLAHYSGTSMRIIGLLLPVLIITQLLTSGKGLAVIQVVKSTLIAVVYACFMLLAIENRLGAAITRVLSGRILGSIGKYSYGMYVLHPFVLSWLGRRGLAHGVAGLAAGVYLSYLAALASWAILEKRFLGLKRYFEYRPVPVAALAAATS